MQVGGEWGKVIDGKKVSSCYKGEIMKRWDFFSAPVILDRDWPLELYYIWFKGTDTHPFDKHIKCTASPSKGPIITLD